MEKKIDSSTSFKVFYEEQMDNPEIREKRRKNAQRSRAVAERFLQLQKQNLPIDEVMAILGREFPVDLHFRRKPPNNVKVVGLVKSPGVITYREGITVLDAILAVGGFDEPANQKEVIIVRSEGDDKKEIAVNMESILKKDSLEEDVALAPGDMIIVKKSLF